MAMIAIFTYDVKPGRMGDFTVNAIQPGRTSRRRPHCFDELFDAHGRYF
jgi:hypothetical protein